MPFSVDQPGEFRMRIMISTLILSMCASVGSWCVAAQQIKLPLKRVLDVPLTGRTSRFDYQSLDLSAGRLYIAHLGDSAVTVFDTRAEKEIAAIEHIKNVHGVLTVSKIGRIYATATGTDELAVIDGKTFNILARVPTGDYPDGIAYAAAENKLYVSNKKGKSDTVIDAKTNKVIGTIKFGAEAGNSLYDEVTNRVYVALGGRDRLVEIDPESDKIVAQYELHGCKGAHGLAVDSKGKVAFVACEDNSTLVAFDLRFKKLLALYRVGGGPDVLAFDTGLRRLYVSAESGTLAIFDEGDEGSLRTVGFDFFAKGAHTVSVDSQTHLVYFPLSDINGKPLIRIEAPNDLRNR